MAVTKTHDVNEMARQVSIGHYVTTLLDEIDPLENDLDRFLRLVRRVGDVSFVIDNGTEDLVDSLGVLAAVTQSWINELMRERSR